MLCLYLQQDVLPHHPGSTQPAFPPAAFVASNVSAATFPDGGAMMPPSHHPPKANAGGPASGALSDLLGLESELTHIQVSQDSHSYLYQSSKSEVLLFV